MRLTRYQILYFLPLLLAPSLIGASQGVDVSFAVQSVTIQDKVAARLGGQYSWSLAAENVGTGQTVIDSGTTGLSFSPGSLIKLIVTGGLLEQNARNAVDLSTIIAIDGTVHGSVLQGNIIIKGSGNPLLTTRDLLGAVEKVKSLGVREIRGDVIVDDSLFDVEGWRSRYSGPAYGVPSALGLDLHTVSIGMEGSRIVVNPPNNAVKVSLNPSGLPGVRRIDDQTYEMTGAIQNAPAFHRRFSLEDPALYAGGTLLTLLEEQGISVSGTTKRGKPSPRAREVARVGAFDVKTMIKDTNQQSLNVAADNLLYLLGALTSGRPGTRKKGIQAAIGFLREMGVPTKGLLIDDGSGMSDRNRISTGQMVEFLRLAAGKPWFKDFRKSLSRPGQDGRLRHFGYRSERIRIKSGELTDSYGIAGYIDREDGKKIAFAYLINGPALNIAVVKNSAVEVLRQLEK